MHKKPYRQYALETKTFTAKITSKRHGPGVNANVFPERTPFAKLPAALLAHVRFVTGVHGAMPNHANVCFEAT